MTGGGGATAWAAYYSLQFEIGPLSEASIGNVGMHPNTIGWVDHMATPVGALGFMIAEDALDRHVITRIETLEQQPAPARADAHGTEPEPHDVQCRARARALVSRDATIALTHT